MNRVIDWFRKLWTPRQNSLDPRIAGFNYVMSEISKSHSTMERLHSEADGALDGGEADQFNQGMRAALLAVQNTSDNTDRSPAP